MRLLTLVGFRVIRSGSGESSVRHLACPEADGRANLRHGVHSRLRQMKATIDQEIAAEHEAAEDEAASVLLDAAVERARRESLAEEAGTSAPPSPGRPPGSPRSPAASPGRAIPAFSPSLAAEGRDILATIPSGSPPSAPSPAHAALRPASPNRRRLKLPSRRRKLKFGGKAAAKNGAVSSDDDDESLPSTSLDDTFEDDSRSSMRI